MLVPRKVKKVQVGDHVVLRERKLAGAVLDLRHYGDDGTEVALRVTTSTGFRQVGLPGNLNVWVEAPLNKTNILKALAGFKRELARVVNIAKAGKPGPVLAEALIDLGGAILALGTQVQHEEGGA